VPFSLAGELVALYLHDMNLIVSAAVGFIPLKMSSRSASRTPAGKRALRRNQEATGNRIRKVAPQPAALSTDIWPP